MIPIKINCSNCTAEIEITTYRKFVACPYCATKIPFEGFEYREIDKSSSMYSSVKAWMDCPACRSKNMYLGSQKRMWKCPDCGYRISNWNRLFGIFWFCDECETFMNIQTGFNTRGGKWKCTECGYVNDVTKKNII